MNQVIRNYTHGSEIILSICEKNGNRFFRKSSYSDHGIENLLREYEGYIWYKARSKKLHTIEKKNIGDNYLELNIPFFENDTEAKKNLNNRDLKFFYEAINHYRDIWVSGEFENKLYPIHGDFSLDGNILFKDRNVFVIDWEHFHKKKAPLGYDVLYMIFESLKIEIKQGSPSRYLLENVFKLIRYAYNNKCISDHFNGNFLEKFLAYQESIIGIWGAQKDKLPTYQYSNTQLNNIIPYFRVTF